MANQFECPDGHKFETDATHRAFCPICGKSAKRIYKPGEQPTVEEVPPSEPPKNDPIVEPIIHPHKVKRIKVPAAKKEEPKETPARKVKIKKKAAPTIKKKVVTTRQRKHEKETKEQTASHWNTFKKFRIL